MEYGRRKYWIAERIKKEIGGGVDVLNSKFVDDYIDATKARFDAMPYGAHKCPQLSKDLSRMLKEGWVTRSRVGMGPGAGNQGFPNWVYVYQLSGFGEMVANLKGAE